MQKNKIRYLPLFQEDLNEAVDYISEKLNNPDAALRLIDNVEAAVNKRAFSPESYAKYHSRKERKYPYYRIIVGNYSVFYVVIDGVMEVRRLIYNKRDLNRQI
ncbi:MAG: type II toxin-antitoxin system RelE/ParE family toxin [Mogibacterium sp.]|nr:type II toxin-antitoxin system RelE/ParE family toxin [Mogibacterium sp.]